MNNIVTIAWKETRSYFASPMAYLVSAAFLAVSGVFFVRSLGDPAAAAEIKGFLDIGGLLLLFVAPALTMRLLAEEQKLGTMELLLTAPVHDHEVVLGKFFAGLLMLGLIFALSLYYPLVLFIFATPDPGPILSGYIGILLLGGASVAIGLFASSLTANQIVSAVVATAILSLFWFLGNAADVVGGTPAQALNFVTTTSHFTPFRQGLIDFKDLIYFLSIIVFFLFLSIRALETRRWR